MEFNYVRRGRRIDRNGMIRDIEEDTSPFFDYGNQRQHYNSDPNDAIVDPRFTDRPSNDQITITEKQRRYMESGSERRSKMIEEANRDAGMSERNLKRRFG